MSDDDEAELAGWWSKISNSPNPIVQLKSFSLGVYAGAFREAADRIAEIETEEAEEIAGILTVMAEQAELDFKRYSGA